MLHEQNNDIISESGGILTITQRKSENCSVTIVPLLFVPARSVRNGDRMQQCSSNCSCFLALMPIHWCVQISEEALPPLPHPIAMTLIITTCMQLITIVCCAHRYCVNLIHAIITYIAMS